MELTPLQRAEQAEQASATDEFRIISEAALAIFGWQDERYKRVLKLLEAGASLDAAMTLVPKHVSVLLFVAAKGTTRATLAGNGDEVPDTDQWEAIAATPALALCAAALRARGETL